MRTSDLALATEARARPWRPPSRPATRSRFARRRRYVSRSAHRSGTLARPWPAGRRCRRSGGRSHQSDSALADIELWVAASTTWSRRRSHSFTCPLHPLWSGSGATACVSFSDRYNVKPPNVSRIATDAHDAVPTTATWRRVCDWRPSPEPDQPWAPTTSSTATRPIEREHQPDRTGDDRHHHFRIGDDKDPDDDDQRTEDPVHLRHAPLGLRPVERLADLRADPLLAGAPARRS